jgi:uncharacterized membrane protein
MTHGPVQLVIVGFDNTDIIGGLLEELDAVREFGIIQLIDFLFVAKDGDGNIAALEVSDLTEEQRMEFGAVVGGLIGLGAAGAEGAEVGAVAGALRVAEHDYGLGVGEVHEVADHIPNGSSACLILFEETWAIGLKDYVLDSGGMLIAQAMLTPAALIEVGEELAASLEAEDELLLAEIEEEEAAATEG